jgi:hypothetical protein
MGLKDLLAAGGRDNFHEAVINGEQLRFYPVRVAAMLRAQSIVSEIARAITSFFDPNEDQYTKRTLHTEQDPESGNITNMSMEEPISPVHAKERLKRRQDSVVAAVEAVMGEDNAAKLAILVIDSLRTDEITVDDLVNGDVATFIALVKETVVANAPQLSPFLAKFAEKMQPRLAVEPSSEDEQAEEA